MSDAAVHQLTPGYNFNGRYYIVRCIGAGGMGSVYEATHSETHGRVALKVMLPRLVHREDMRGRFMQEARVTARIQSDHIVTVFDAGIDETTGMPFIVMELLVGEDLDALITRMGKLEPAAVVTLIQQAALALDKTHAAGVVHRDLKPHNLFITRRDDGSPCVKILDFGIAKLIDATGGAQRTRSTGTPVYMPPEQVRGEGDIGAAADAYALAHIAYTALTGHPYWETEAIELGLGPFIECIFAGPRESPVARAARSGVRLPPAFDAWFMRAASASREMRILPTSQLAESLGAVFGLSGAGISAASLPSAPGIGAVPHGGPSHAVSPLTPVSATHGATHGAVVAERREPRDKGGTKPIWFLVGALVVLASVAVGALITARFTDRSVVTHNEDDDDRTTKKNKKKKKKGPTSCPWERCVDAEVDKRKPFEPLDYLSKANKVARAMESENELVMLSVSELVKGRIPRDAQFSMAFLYRYPKPGGEAGEFAGLQVVLAHGMLMGRQSPDVGVGPVPQPRCTGQQALKAAFADGLDPTKRTTMVYQLAPGASAPQWQVVQTASSAQVRYIHGVTCKGFDPF